MKRVLLISVMLFLAIGIDAQPYKKTELNRHLKPYPEVHGQRLGLVLGGYGTLYAGTWIALYHFWYKDYPTTGFHWFNDNAEWMQIDKAGHMHTAYFYSAWTAGLYHWAGVKKKNAYWYGALTGSIAQLTIEVFDGFSEKWGASYGDLIANTSGALLFAGQGMLWDEQRIVTKYSFHGEDPGSDPVLIARAESLYGTNVFERALKDYNGATYWLSVNPYSFMKEDSKFPQWLNFAVGYGAQNMYGGFKNEWCDDPEVRPEDCDPAMLTDYTHIPRYRQIYLAPDIDFTKINTNSRLIKIMLHGLNALKMPAPALEFGTDGSVVWHWLYF